MPRSTSRCSTAAAPRKCSRAEVLGRLPAPARWARACSCATRRSCSGRRTTPSSTARTFSTFSPSSTSRRIRKMKQLTIREAADFLLRNDNYVLLTHRRPDGDTIGSAAALCAGLRSLGKTAHVLENPQFTEKFRPWLGKLTCETLPSSACVVSVDIAAENLLPFDLPDCAVELQIDHHAGNRQFGRRPLWTQAQRPAARSSCGAAAHGRQARCLHGRGPLCRHLDGHRLLPLQQYDSQHPALRRRLQGHRCGHVRHQHGPVHDEAPAAPAARGAPDGEDGILRRRGRRREHAPERPARGAGPDGGRRGRYLRLQP